VTNSAENGSRKEELAVEIGSILFNRDITMGQAAKRLDITQTAVAQILNRNLDDFSVVQLEGFLQVLAG
jgi:predicted XRE-type DNA-binding protein